MNAPFIPARHPGSKRHQPTAAELRAGLESEQRSPAPAGSMDAIPAAVCLMQLARREKLHVPDPDSSEQDRKDLAEWALQRDTPQHRREYKGVNEHR